MMLVLRRLTASLWSLALLSTGLGYGVGATASTPQDSARCWDTVREYARSMNDGDFTKAYSMLAVPVQAVISETEWRQFHTLAVAEGSLTSNATDRRALDHTAGIKTELILAVQEPEVQGATAIVGVVMVTFIDPLSAAEEIQRLQDPEYVKASRLPTWGDQLRTLGLTPEDCDLVPDLRSKLGDPETSFWWIEKRWVVASFNNEGRWKIWPSIDRLRASQIYVNLSTYMCDAAVRFGNGIGGDTWPSICPKPSAENVCYVRWNTVVVNPSMCPKCHQPMQGVWRYCPNDGTELKRGRGKKVSPAPPDAGR